MEIYAVRINGLNDPLGYLYDNIICSWKVRGTKGKKQINASIKVALDPEFKNIIYVKSDSELSSLGVTLEVDLAPTTRYYYFVEVTTDENESVKSEIHWFETAKRDDPWVADWIGINNNEDIHPEFLKEFEVKKDIKQARLYICGLGLFYVCINDVKVGDDYLAPFINDYLEHIQYCSYDVTGLLKQNNEMHVLLGKGWYMGRFDSGIPADLSREFALIAELHVEYRNGAKDVIKTDDTWKYQKSFHELTDIYDGEIQDFLQYSAKQRTLQRARRTAWSSRKS